jgi:hypothetical protein
MFEALPLIHTIEFSVKSRKNSTRTLEKKPAKKYISIQEGVKLRNVPFLVVN